MNFRGMRRLDRTHNLPLQALRNLAILSLSGNRPPKGICLITGG